MQQVACEAPPPSHIAHSMVDQVLDMNEDASTEAGSTESVEGSSSFGSGSPSDDLSDESDVPALTQLLTMGFSEAAARSALDRTRHRGVDAAVALLIDGVVA